MKVKNKNIITCVLLIIEILSVLLCVEVYRCATKLTLAQYEVKADVSESIRIVQLSDLHSRSYGESNQVLVDLVCAQQPDMVIMTGDMMDKRDKNADVACDLINVLSECVPVYYSYGNHEREWMAKNSTDLTDDISGAGAVVLDTEYVDVIVKGQALRIGGCHGYYRYPGMFPVSSEQYEAEMIFAEDFENTDSYKILLCHIPTGWLDWGNIDKFPVDLVFCGHYHGGQIRLPVFGGIYAPYVGFFPSYTEGMYVGEQATCILSTGVGASPDIPRINNLPQVVVVDLVSQSQTSHK